MEAKELQKKCEEGGDARDKEQKEKAFGSCNIKVDGVPANFQLWAKNEIDSAIATDDIRRGRVA